MLCSVARKLLFIKYFPSNAYGTLQLATRIEFDYFVVFCNMTSILLHPEPKFNLDVKVGASRASRWGKWLKDFEILIAASGITRNACKCALLLYQAGSIVCDIFARLSDTGEATDYDTAKAKLTQHFQQQKNVRYDFMLFVKLFSKSIKLLIITIRVCEPLQSHVNLTI